MHPGSRHSISVVAAAYVKDFAKSIEGEERLTQPATNKEAAEKEDRKGGAKGF